MSATSAVLAGRRAAEALMGDTAEVYRRTGNIVQDEDTGREVPEYAFQLQSRCKVQARSVTLTETDTGGRQLTVTRFEVHLPVAAGEVAVDDEIEIVETGPASDPQLLGSRFRVRGHVPKSYATAQRLDVEEAQT